MDSAEDIQWEMANLPEDLRVKAAAEFFAHVLAKTPVQYQDPWLKNALRDGIETTLGIRDLPEEGEA